MIDIEALRNRVQKLEREHKQFIDKIISNAVFDNAKYKVGDILIGSNWSIEVTKIKWSKGGFHSVELNPEAVYFGYVLTKKLVRRKDLDTAAIYENDVKSKANKGKD